MREITLIGCPAGRKLVGRLRGAFKCRFFAER